MKTKLLHEAGGKRTFAVILRADERKRCIASRNSPRSRSDFPSSRRALQG
jgi:hypothetical protein